MKKSRMRVFVSVFVLAANPVCAQTFSLAAFPPFSGAPPPAGIPPDGIAFPGPAPYLPGAGAILPGSTFIDVDAIDYGRLGITGFSAAKVAHYEFSVSLFSAPPVGVGAVGAEATTFDHFADIYTSDGTGSNLLLWDGDGIPSPGAPLAGAFGIPELGAPNDVDAWANNPGPSFYGPIFFSVAVTSAAAAYGPFSGADVFITAPAVPPYDMPAPGPLPAPPFFATVYAPAGLLGLDVVGGPNTDDIDALVILDDGDFIFSGAFGVDTILFSLRPGSPALTAAPYAGASPADILFADTTGAAGIFLPAGALGLLPTSDLDALDIQIKPVATSVKSAMSNEVVISWADLDPPRVYIVAASPAVTGLPWTVVGGFTATLPSQAWTNSGAPSAALFRLER